MKLQAVRAWTKKYIYIKERCILLNKNQLPYRCFIFMKKFFSKKTRCQWICNHINVFRVSVIVDGLSCFRILLMTVVFDMTSYQLNFFRLKIGGFSVAISSFSLLKRLFSSSVRGSSSSMSGTTDSLLSGTLEWLSAWVSCSSYTITFSSSSSFLSTSTTVGYGVSAVVSKLL